MATITQTLGDHHGLCDELFAKCEVAAREQRWAALEELHTGLARALEAHMRAEDTVLFPAFESVTGLKSGPTQVMREEHLQMRDMLARLGQAASQRQGQPYCDLGETFLRLLQQHNRKEENILYPMCDHALAQRVPELTDRLAEVLAES